jgi:hypothetical protein
MHYMFMCLCVLCGIVGAHVYSKAERTEFLSTHANEQLTTPENFTEK